MQSVRRKESFGSKIDAFVTRLAWKLGIAPNFKKLLIKQCKRVITPETILNVPKGMTSRAHLMQIMDRIITNAVTIYNFELQTVMASCPDLHVTMIECVSWGVIKDNADYIITIKDSMGACEIIHITHRDCPYFERLYWE